MIFLYELMEKSSVSLLINFLNSFHSNLKFKYETSSCTDNFLDLNVSWKNFSLIIFFFISHELA